MRTTSDIEAEVASLGDLSRDELAAQWKKIYKCPPPKGVRRELLLRATVWHHQAKRLGGYSTETRRLIRSTIEQAGKKSTESDVPPSLLSNNTKATTQPKRKQVSPGARLLRDWNGKTHVVDVIEGGYVFEAKVYPSLTAIASKITGVHWSGPRFFGL